MIPLNYHHLYYFYTIAREGGVAKAARALYLAQPTLSAQLKELEAALKRRLFERQGRRLVLTEDGHVVLRYAEEIFRLGRELEDDLRDRPAGGVLTVQLGVTPGAPRAAVEALVAAALAAGAAHADCREAPLAALIADLADHRIDILLSDACDATHAGTDRRWRRVARLPVSFAARRPGAAAYILPKAPADVYRQAQTALAEAGGSARAAAEVPDMESARRLAATGAGAAPLDSLTLRGSGLVPVPDAPSGLRLTLWLAVAGRRLRPNPVAERLYRSFRLNG